MATPPKKAAKFPPEALCLDLDKLYKVPTLDDICFPGGVCLSHIWDGVNKIPHGSDMYLDFFSQIGPAMTWLGPFNNIMDTCLAIFRCVKAIPDSIMKLDPSELLKCMPALAEHINQLLKLMPYLSLPKLVKVAIKNVARLIQGIADDLRYIESQLRRIADMIDRAADLNDVKMNGFLVCAQDTTNGMMMSTADALKGIGRIILAINILIGLFGGPEIPCFSTIIEDNIEEGFDVVVNLLLMLASLLDDLSDMIPDPDYTLTLALGEQRC